MIPLQCPEDAPAALNRRVAVRHHCRPGTSGTVAASRYLVSRSAVIENISVTGLALRLRRSLKRGSRLLIQLTNEALGLAYDLSARVVHSTRQADGRWRVGCDFARALSATEFDTLL